jgi:hypothetical protein
MRREYRNAAPTGEHDAPPRQATKSDAAFVQDKVRLAIITDAEVELSSSDGHRRRRRVDRVSLLWAASSYEPEGATYRIDRDVPWRVVLEHEGIDNELRVRADHQTCFVAEAKLRFSNRSGDDLVAHKDWRLNRENTAPEIVAVRLSRLQDRNGSTTRIRSRGWGERNWSSAQTKRQTCRTKKAPTPPTHRPNSDRATNHLSPAPLWAALPARGQGRLTHSLSTGGRKFTEQSRSAVSSRGPAGRL